MAPVGLAPTATIPQHQAVLTECWGSLEGTGGTWVCQQARPRGEWENPAPTTPWALLAGVAGGRWFLPRGARLFPPCSSLPRRLGQLPCPHHLGGPAGSNGAEASLRRCLSHMQWGHCFFRGGSTLQTVQGRSAPSMPQLPLPWELGGGPIGASAWGWPLQCAGSRAAAGRRPPRLLQAGIELLCLEPVRH